MGFLLSILHLLPGVLHARPAVRVTCARCAPCAAATAAAVVPSGTGTAQQQRPCAAAAAVRSSSSSSCAHQLCAALVREHPPRSSCPAPSPSSPSYVLTPLTPLTVFGAGPAPPCCSGHGSCTEISRAAVLPMGVMCWRGANIAVPGDIEAALEERWVQRSPPLARLPKGGPVLLLLSSARLLQHRGWLHLSTRPPPRPPDPPFHLLPPPPDSARYGDWRTPKYMDKVGGAAVPAALVCWRLAPTIPAKVCPVAVHGHACAWCAPPHGAHKWCALSQQSGVTCSSLHR